MFWAFIQKDNHPIPLLQQSFCTSLHIWDKLGVIWQTKQRYFFAISGGSNFKHFKQLFMTLSGLGLLTMWELPRRVSYFVSNFLQNYFRCLILSWVPLHFLPSKPSFLYDHFTTQHSDFSSFLAVSTTDKPCLCSHVAELFCVKGSYLSWYSQKNTEGVRAIRAIKYKNYVAGKYTRAHAPFAWKYTNLN